MKLGGRVLSYAESNDVNTDVIWPGKYTYVQIPFEDMPKHAMETFDPAFASKLAGREVLVVGSNFGCGSSREQASECLLASGVRLIVAQSFARIFYRNSINLGLAVVECPDAVEAIAALGEGAGDASLSADLERGELALESGGETRVFPIAPYPSFVLELIRDGGLIEHIRKGGGA